MVSTGDVGDKRESPSGEGVEFEQNRL